MADLSDRIIDHYERHAHTWAQDRRQAAFNDKPWHERFIDALADGARVLDLGCGSGVPAALMVARGLRVTGVDSSPSLISLCRQAMPDETWIVADMRSLALPAKFDGILAWDSFFHLNPDDQRSMFQVFARHAAEPAVLMFNAGPAPGEPIGSYRGDPLYHASLAPAEYESLLERIGFEILCHVAEDTGAGGRTAWLARSRATDGLSRESGKG